MILADKIILLRKKSGLSQEELADKLEVSRQSVSKWESAQSIPDLDRILAMSNLFGVSTDMLLKDELEIMEDTVVENEIDPTVEKVTMEQATEYIKKSHKKALFIALGVLLCVISPITLILLAGLCDAEIVSETLIYSIGLPVLFVIIAVALTLFIVGDNLTKEYKYISTKPFETEYGVTGLAKEKQSMYQSTYNKFEILGIVICVLSVIPLFATIPTDNDLYIIIGVCSLLAVVSIGSFILVFVNTKMEVYKQLLQEGDFSKAMKAKSPVITAITTVYWIIVTGVFLLVSFLTKSWEWTWLIWVGAGLIYAAWSVIMKAGKNMMDNNK